jgi:mRNA interferase MazF
MVRIDPDAENKLSKPSAADAFRIRSISTERLVRRIGRISEAVEQEVLKAVCVVIGAEAQS